MALLPLIHFDCKFFEGDKPCFANKQYGVFCSSCTYYEKEPHLPENFPEIPKGPEFSSGQNHASILIIKLDAVGDVLRTTSVLRAIKNQLPDSSITWITKSKSNPVLEDNKSIDMIVFIEDGLDDVTSRNFDIAVNLDSGKASCEVMLRISSDKKYGFTLANGKPYPVNSFANEWFLMGIDDNFKKQNTKSYHKIIHEICGLKFKNYRPVLELSESKRIKAAYLKEKTGLHNYSGFILVNLGGGSRWQFKKWTKEGCSELINRLSTEKPNTAIGAVAGQEDIEFYNDVIARVERKDNVFLFGCGNPTEDFISMIYLADKVFTSDSLAFHIATALDKYTVVLVGPTSHTELDVFGNGSILFSRKVDCLCCYLNKCDKTFNCMNTVSVDDVIDFFR